MRLRAASSIDNHPPISTHTPHTGCDQLLCPELHSFYRFQLTHPTRGATLQIGAFRDRKIADFNSHTPHGVRLVLAPVRLSVSSISTHTPHTGCDNIINCDIVHLRISTHTPHTGCDQYAVAGKCVDPGGTRTTNTGGDRYSSAVICPSSISTHTPHTGCDFGTLSDVQDTDISTHTPHTGCDYSLAAAPDTIINFNSHTPHGVRLPEKSPKCSRLLFQLTHPTRGATVTVWVMITRQRAFQLTHPTRGATLLPLLHHLQ